MPKKLFVISKIEGQKMKVKSPEKADAVADVFYIRNSVFACFTKKIAVKSFP